MRTLVIEPLKEWYVEEYLRTTNLEKLLSCPYRFMNDEYKESKQQTFGKFVHKVLQTFLFNKDTTREFIFEYYLPQLEWDERKLMREYIALADANIPNIIAMEEEVEVRVEMWNTLYIIWGRIDMFHSLDYLWDIKTSKSERSIKDLVWKLQPYIYWYWLNIEKWKWTYWIFTKHKRWARLQTDMEFEITESQAEEKIKEVIILYDYFKKNEFPRKRNNYCRKCQFNDECTVLNINRQS